MIHLKFNSKFYDKIKNKEKTMTSRPKTKNLDVGDIFKACFVEEDGSIIQSNFYLLCVESYEDHIDYILRHNYKAEGYKTSYEMFYDLTKFYGYDFMKKALAKSYNSDWYVCKFTRINNLSELYRDKLEGFFFEEDE